MRKTVCVLLLVVGCLAVVPWAATQAVFTDQGSVGSNTFTAGNVDIATTPASAIVALSAMAPGDTTTGSVVVSNSGSLQLRYAVSSSATNADSKGLRDQLSLIVKTIDVTTPASPCDNFDGTQLYSGDLDGTTGALVGDPAQGSQTGDRTVNAGGSETLCFRVSLPSSTGNAYQSATTTATFTFDAEQTANN
jgi:hypothetical protein